MRHFLIFSENAALAADLSAQQHQALLAIKGRRPKQAVTAGLLAERLGIRHHSAVGLLDRLAEKGMVRRERSRADRRQMLIVPTTRPSGCSRGYRPRIDASCGAWRPCSAVCSRS